MISKDPVDLAWCAGLFVGEGSFGTVRSFKENRSHYYLYAKLQLSMMDEYAVKKFVHALDLTYCAYKPKDRDYVMHSARGSGERALSAMEAMFPYLEGTDKEKQYCKYLDLLEDESSYDDVPRRG